MKHFLPILFALLSSTLLVADDSLVGQWKFDRDFDGKFSVKNMSVDLPSVLLFAFQNDGNFLSLGLNIGGNYAECDALTDTKEVMDGNWHLVAGTFDGKTMRGYLDGKEIGSYQHRGSSVPMADEANFSSAV